jgi:ribosomal protein S6--L-glutamate ligase
MLRFGVISAFPKEDWHSRRLVEVCASRGTVDVLRPSDLGFGWERDRPVVIARGRDARSWDVWLLPRALGDRGDQDFQCGAYRALEEAGAVVVNRLPALLEAEDKVRTSWLLARAGVPTPAFAAVQSWREAEDALARLGPCIAKPPYGSLGIGLELIEVDDALARARLAAMLETHGVLYLQQRVVAAGPRGGRRRRARDLRLFVVGGGVPAAMERVAAPGEWRTNIGQGGTGRAIDPDDDQIDVAVRAARALGLDYAGVDAIETERGITVIEVNGTPRWQGLEEATRRDMAEEIVSHATRVAQTSKETQHGEEDREGYADGGRGRAQGRAEGP